MRSILWQTSMPVRLQKIRDGVLLQRLILQNTPSWGLSDQWRVR